MLNGSLSGRLAVRVLSPRTQASVSGLNRYLGCDHVQEKNVLLSTDDHTFAYLFDKSLPDPAAKTAAAANRTQDFWEVEPGLGVYVRHHCQPRKGYFVPDEAVIRDCELSSIRFTDVLDGSPGGDVESEWDQFQDETGNFNQGKKRANLWVGTTYLSHVGVQIQRLP